MKEWAVREESRLQFQVEIFNLFNTANFDFPVRDFNQPNFGSVVSAQDSRQIQLGFRLDF